MKRAFIIGVLFAAGSATAVPQQMVYEGYLTDLADRPFEGSITLELTLHPRSSGDETLWSEEIAGLEVRGGYFSLRIGERNPLPASLFEDDDLYLGIRVDGGEILPRAQLASVAFARRSGQADDVAGRNIHPNSVTIGDRVVIDENGRWLGDPTGLTGPRGEPGEIGPQGERGANGADGEPGVAGLNGENGAAGIIGERGATGETGAQGIRGAQGATGPPGATGERGAQGLVGERGPQGDRGIVGDRGVIGPAGAVGAQGTTGDRGAQGDLGPEGSRGLQGAEGATGVRGPTGATGAAGATGATGPVGARGAAGTSYVHWGIASCPGGAEMVYAGVAAGGAHNHGGSGANTLCLPNNPQHRDFHDSDHNGALVYGIEFETSSYGLSHLSGHQNRDAVCAVCWVPDRSHTLMIPGRYDCLQGWTEAYDGQLMASHYTQTKSEFVCVARNPTLAGSASNNNGGLWYPTEVECGSLNCGATGYRQNRELSCVVCTR
jgi:hypothetical protein